MRVDYEGQKKGGLKKPPWNIFLGRIFFHNTKILMDILNGKPGAKRDIVVLNAAAAIYAADKAGSIRLFQPCRQSDAQMRSYCILSDLLSETMYYDDSTYISGNSLVIFRLVAFALGQRYKHIC